VAVQSDQNLCEEVEDLAREIAGPFANTQIKILAHRIAQAQVDLRRVRQLRYQFLSDKLSDLDPDAQANGGIKTEVLCGPLLPSTSPQGPDRIAGVLLQEAKPLHAMDRYERRAISRRKSAIRALDAERHRNA
jgi:hypothetical protein